MSVYLVNLHYFEGLKSHFILNIFIILHILYINKLFDSNFWFTIISLLKINIYFSIFQVMIIRVR